MVAGSAPPSTNRPHPSNNTSSTAATRSYTNSAPNKPYTPAATPHAVVQTNPAGTAPAQAVSSTASGATSPSSSHATGASASASTSEGPSAQTPATCAAATPIASTVQAPSKSPASSASEKAASETAANQTATGETAAKPAAKSYFDDEDAAAADLFADLDVDALVAQHAKTEHAPSA